jgi:surface protein
MKDAKTQIFVTKGYSPWFNGNWGNDYYEYMDIWEDSSHVVSVDESVPGQATVTCDGNITDMSYMFNLTHLTSLDLSNFDSSNVTNMRSMFEDCRNLTSIDLSNFDTSNVGNTYAMFSGCRSLTTLDLTSFDTSKVINMSYMFYNCPRLTTIKGVIDMKSCEYYGNMFTNCNKLRGVKIKNPPFNFEIISGLSKSQYTIIS